MSWLQLGRGDICTPSWFVVLLAWQNCVALPNSLLMSSIYLALLNPVAYFSTEKSARIANSAGVGTGALLFVTCHWMWRVRRISVSEKGWRTKDKNYVIIQPRNPRIQTSVSRLRNFIKIWTVSFENLLHSYGAQKYFLFTYGWSTKS